MVYWARVVNPFLRINLNFRFNENDKALMIKREVLKHKAFKGCDVDCVELYIVGEGNTYKSLEDDDRDFCDPTINFYFYVKKKK